MKTVDSFALLSGGSAHTSLLTEAASGREVSGMLRHQVPSTEGKVPSALPDTAKQVACGMAFVTAIHLAADTFMAIVLERMWISK